MIRQIIDEIENANGAVALNTLCLKLGIDRSACEGMFQYLIRTGRLVKESDLTEPGDGVQGCASTCAKGANCPFVAKMPDTYTLKNKYRQEITRDPE